MLEARTRPTSTNSPLRCDTRDDEFIHNLALWAREQDGEGGCRQGMASLSLRGQFADTLLWRDKKRTLTALLVLVAIYYNFIASGFTLLTTLSKLLLATSVFLFIHGILPEKVLGYTVEKIPRSRFHLSEEMSRRVALSVASSWNVAVDVLKSLSTGHDWTLFLKVVLSLLLLSLLGAISFQSLFVIGVLSTALMNLKQHLMILAHEMCNSVNELAGRS
nr:isoform 3 of 3beta-hydroxysteroid-dehydrogenase/decarboxylase isoform 2 [Quercus suber]